MTSPPMTLGVGLAGAGPWATMVTAPMLAAGPETRLTGVWSRTRASAEKLAAAHAVPAFDRYEVLLASCDAVALAVPPTVQPGLAVTAARAGRHLLLEKPLAVDVEGARRMAGAVATAGVVSLVMLSYRYAAPVRRFLDDARAFSASGARACFLSGAFLGGPFAYGWRLERGALLDVGPHVIDLVDAALGPVVAVQARGDVHRWVGLLLHHDGGAVSDVALSCTIAIEPSRTEVELFGPSGSLALDARAIDRRELFATLRREFAETVAAGGGHPVGVVRGLHLQRVVAAAERSLADGTVAALA